MDGKKTKFICISYRLGSWAGKVLSIVDGASIEIFSCVVSGTARIQR